jgi:hypothetical protein
MMTVAGGLTGFGVQINLAVYSPAPESWGCRRRGIGKRHRYGAHPRDRRRTPSDGQGVSGQGCYGTASGGQVRERASVPDGREHFLLDFYQGTIRINKVTSNHRYARTIVLARLCLNGPTHTNPDGERIDGTHLHLYREGYGDKWAEPLDSATFSDPTDPVTSLHQFLIFLHVHHPPPIQGAFI